MSTTRTPSAASSPQDAPGTSATAPLANDTRPPAPPRPVAGTRRTSRWHTLLGTGAGNAMEWYDWNVYASFAAFFSGQIFHNSDPTSAFMSTLAVFAVGFVARPFGGALFGWVADRVGRKHSMMLSVLLASVGSLLIAICPTYHQWGWGGGLVLVVARIVQGLAHGGELPSAQTYLAEEAPADRRGLWSSSIYITGTVGMLVGMVLGLVLSDTLTKNQMNSFGWRIPFALGAVFGLFSLWMRSRLPESEIFEHEVVDEHAPRVNVFLAVLHNWRRSLQVIFITSGLTISYYVWSVSMASLAQKTLGFSANQAFTASIIGTVVLIAALAPWGMFSDRFGRKPNLLIAMFGCAILYIPVEHMIHHQTWQLALGISLMLLVLAADLAVAPAVYAEMFQTGNRASGMAIPYAIAIALFGGTAPYLNAAWAHHHGRFQAYAITMLVISGLVTLTLKETRGIDLHHRD